MPAAASIDVLLPKHITDSCYASITQIYRDMFELTPKSSLKLSSANSSSRLNLKTAISPTRFVGGGRSTSVSSEPGENVLQDMYQEQRKTSFSRIFNLGSLKRNASANINNYPIFYGDDKAGHYQHQHQHNYSSPTSSSYYYGDKDSRRSDRRFDKNYYYGNYSGANFDKKSRMRASWHEGDTKKSVIGTKIEFVTRL